MIGVQRDEFSEIIRKTAFFQKGKEGICERFFEFKNTRSFIRSGELITELSVEIQSGIFRNRAVQHANLLNNEFSANNGHVHEHGVVVSASVDENGEGLGGGAVFVAGVAGSSGSTRGTELAIQVQALVAESFLANEVVGSHAMRDIPTGRNLGLGFGGVGFFALNFGESLIVEGRASGREALGCEDQRS